MDGDRLSVGGNLANGRKLRDRAEVRQPDSHSLHRRADWHGLAGHRGSCGYDKVAKVQVADQRHHQLFPAGRHSNRRAYPAQTDLG